MHSAQVGQVHQIVEAMHCVPSAFQLHAPTGDGKYTYKEENLRL